MAVILELFPSDRGAVDGSVETNDDANELELGSKAKTFCPVPAGTDGKHRFLAQACLEAQELVMSSIFLPPVGKTTARHVSKHRISRGSVMRSASAVFGDSGSWM